MRPNKEAKERKIAVYWDYENVPLPRDCSPADAAKAISSALSPHGGRIETRRVYYDPYQKNRRPRDPSGLDSSGFDLVQTPSRNEKETLDKKLIADVLVFAWDCTVEDREPCIVLITSDGDYAYTLSKLRDRGVTNIVMYGRDCSTAEILISNAEVALSFERDVLMALPSAPVLDDSEHADGYSDMSQKARRNTSTCSPEEQLSRENSQFVAASDSLDSSSAARRCSSISTTWTTSTHQSCEDENSEQASREDAPSPTSVAAPVLDKSCVSIRNVPRGVGATELARYFHSHCFPVVRVGMEPPMAEEADFCRAHVQFAKESDGPSVIRISRRSGLLYGDVPLDAAADVGAPPDQVFQNLPRHLVYENGRPIN